MSEEATVCRVRWRQVCPWLRLGQALGCALAPQQVVLGCAAALLWMLVQELLPGEPPRLTAEYEVTVRLPVQPGPLQSWTFDWSDLAGPVVHVLNPAWTTIAEGASSRTRTLAAVTAALAFGLWSFVGAALARCAALQFCRDENPSLRLSVQGTLRSKWDILLAPAAPVGGAALLVLLAAAAALPASIPALGRVWIWICSPLEVVFGTAAAFILLMMPLLWPLMIAAISVDRCDGFGAFSRSFSCVASHPWQTGGLLLVCGGYAMIASSLLELLFRTTGEIVAFGVSWTTTKATAETLLPFVKWWTSVAYQGVAASLFWTLSTMIYVFLRQSTDGVPLSVVAGVEEPPPPEPYPVVGLSAMPAPGPAGAPEPTAP